MAPRSTVEAARRRTSPDRTARPQGRARVGYERNGRRATVGVIDAGEFHFGTDAPERMTVLSGELWAKLPGESAWRAFPAGTVFEVPGKSGFDVKAALPSAYHCEFL